MMHRAFGGRMANENVSELIMSPSCSVQLNNDLFLTNSRFVKNSGSLESVLS